MEFRKNKPYPAYKDSGVEWIGRVPEGWEVNKIKYVTSFVYGNSLPKESRDEGGIPVCGSNGIFGFHSCSNTKSPVIVIGRKGSYGKVSYHNVPVFSIDTTYFIDSRFSKENLKWLYYVLQTVGLDTLSRDTGVPGLSREQALMEMIPVPQKNEQHQIASFLDHRTTKIDQLIQEKQELIELLKKKKTALITKCVTKGLDDNVPMKDSGVEWIGDIPEHWEVMKNRWLFKIEKRIAGKLGYDILSITQKGLVVKDVNSWEGQCSMNYTKYQIVEPGDFAMNHMDLLTGGVGVSSRLGVTSPDYRVFKPYNKIVNSSYFLKLFQMGYYLKIFYAHGRGVSHLGRWRFPNNQFKEFLLPVPPLAEQHRIASYLDQQITKIDQAINEIQESIDLLQRYRTSLITHAVTGKIDVRDWSTDTDHTHNMEAAHA